MEKKCQCPFCEHELTLECFEPVFCQNCNIKLMECKKCSKLFNEKLEKCPKCGEKNNR